MESTDTIPEGRSLGLTAAGRVRMENGAGRIDGLKAAQEIVREQRQIADAMWHYSNARALEEVERLIGALIEDWTGGAGQ